MCLAVGMRHTSYRKANLEALNEVNSALRDFRAFPGELEEHEKSLSLAEFHYSYREEMNRLPASHIALLALTLSFAAFVVGQPLAASSAWVGILLALGIGVSIILFSAMQVRSVLTAKKVAALAVAKAVLERRETNRPPSSNDPHPSGQIRKA